MASVLSQPGQEVRKLGGHPPNPRPLGEGCFQGIRVHPASRAELGFKPGLAPQSMPWRKLWRVTVTPSESCSVTFWLERLDFLIFMLGMVMIPTSQGCCEDEKMQVIDTDIDIEIGVDPDIDVDIDTDTVIDVQRQVSIYVFRGYIFIDCVSLENPDYILDNQCTPSFIKYLVRESFSVIHLQQPHSL